ncbi:MAG TPA: SDR family NAD(P)-dependent oxidoreductase, partial [Polyangiaceae bacterium]|nr:SDR family NAD(P)-dependent oxidoreductase [Polyangiaceae bacterium]
MKKLEGRIAIVTGADSGIGRAVAEEFAKEGADVVVTFHTDRAGADETGARVAAAGRRAIVRQADVRDEAAVAAFFADAERELGAPPYILVNNAGIGGGGKPVADLETADFDAVIKTDLYGPFFCIREFVRRRRGLGGAGKIINVTSVHEVTPSPNNV